MQYMAWRELARARSGPGRQGLAPSYAKTMQLFSVMAKQLVAGSEDLRMSQLAASSPTVNRVPKFTKTEPFEHCVLHRQQDQSAMHPMPLAVSRAGEPSKG